MKFDDLIFKTVVNSRRVGAACVTLKEREGTIIITLNVQAREMGNLICNGYNSIELLASGDSTFAIKTKIKPRSTNQTQFTATALRGIIKNLPFNKKLNVVMYKDMIVCDLRKLEI